MALNTLIPLILSGLPPALITDIDKARLEKIAQDLPLASGGILELPLGQETGPVGWGVHLTEKDGGFSMLEDSATHFKAAVGNKVWAALADFARTRKVAGHPLRRAVKQAWLEFDITPKTKALPTPSFFFKLAEPFNHPPTVAALNESAPHSVTVIQQGLDILGLTPDEASLATLARCIKARNASTSIAYVGLMLGRNAAPGFRLVLSGMQFYSIMGYLRKIEYPHAKGLLPLTNFLAQRMGIETFSLQLDIDGDVQPRLGIEIGMDPKLNVPAAWQNFLGQLTHTGASTPAKAAALPGWIRQFTRTEMSEKWPAALGRKYGTLDRSISHLKFSYQPGYFSQDIPPGDFSGPLVSQAHAGEISAKAYLAYQAATLSPGPLWA